MTSSRLDQKFNNEVIIDNLPYYLDFVVEWLKKNMEPLDIFTEEELGMWAMENGYRRI